MTPMGEAGARLFGRDDVLAELLGGLRPAGRAPAMVLLGGDAGVGKTALIRAATRHLERERTVLVGHCVGETAGSLSYLPFVEAFGRLDTSDPGAVDEIVAAYPAFARLVPRRAPLDDAGDRGNIVEAVHGGLELLGRRHPLLFVVEDLHWADESTRELITLLLARGFTAPVAIVATYRGDDLHRRHPLRPRLVEWSRTGRVRRVEVAPLPSAAVRELVCAADGALPDDVVADIVRRADGNAFIAEELVAASRRGPADADDLGVLLLRRLDVLDEQAQEVVRVASVAGRRVGHALLAAVAGVEGSTLDRLLREAIDRHVLEVTRDGDYAFRHALLAEAVYDDLLPGERHRYHRACADALRARPTLGTAADLARHAIAVHDVELAVSSSLDAARAALRIGGPAEAHRHFENALSLLDDGDERTHRLTLDTAAAALACGRVAAAAHLLRARLDREAAPLERVELLIRLAGVLPFADDAADPLALVEEAMGLMPPTADDDLRADLLTRRVEALWRAGRVAEMLVQTEELTRLGLLEGRPHLRTEVDSAVARARSHETDGAESLAAIDHAIAAWGDEADTSVLRAMHTRAGIYCRQDRLDDALAAYLTAVDTARRARLDDSPFAVYSRALAVITAYELGQWDRALELASPERSLPPEMTAELEAAASYVHAARGSGQVVETYEHLRRYWKLDSSIALQSGAAALDHHGRNGDVDAARAVRRDVVAHLRECTGRRHVMVEVRLDALLLGHLANFIERAPAGERPGVLAEAAELASEARAVWATEHGLPPKTLEALAWESRARAEHLRLRWLAGEPVALDALVAAWEECRDLFGGRGDRYEVARSRARLAHVLLAAGRCEDADAERQAAFETARELRAAPLLAELGSAAPSVPSRLDGAPDPEGGGPAAGLRLTPRELDVLALVARGRSNGEIGRLLFITTKTASVHVSRILAKLGARNRSEAAALARDRGLVE